MLLLLAVTALAALAVGALLGILFADHQQQSPRPPRRRRRRPSDAPGTAPPDAGCVENTPHPSGMCTEEATPEEYYVYDPVCIDGVTYENRAAMECRDIPDDAPRRPGRCCPSPPPTPVPLPSPTPACVEGTPHPVGILRGCPRIKKPVCVDGMTYGNSCVASTHRIPPNAVWREGPCCPN